MGAVLAVIGAVLFLAAGLLYGGALRSEFRLPDMQVRAAFALAGVGLPLLVLALVPIPGVTR